MQTPTRSGVRNRKSSGFAAALWLAAAGTALLPAIATTTPAFALSEIKREELPTPPAQTLDNEATGETAAPQGEEAPGATAPSSAAHANEDPNTPLPEIIYDISKLPEPVQRMRQLILDVAMGGDIEKLRTLVGTGDDATQLSVTGLEGDPIEFLKELSGDKDGEEILAIIENVLNAGYVHLDPGTPEELYAWPYFFAMPLERLTPRQRVELFKIVTAGDYEDMKSDGAYNFYRLGITPEGKWAFFVAGD